MFGRFPDADVDSDVIPPLVNRVFWKDRAP